MPAFGWRPGDAGRRAERRVGGERRSGADRRAPVRPPVPPERQPRVVRPTDRQLQVLAAIASGDTYAETARALALSEHTVRTHLAAVRQRLHAANAAQAVAVCILRGWLVPNR